MSEHECIIGCFCDDGMYDIVTLSELVEILKRDVEFYEKLKEDCRRLGVNIKPPYTLKDYCDMRKSTNMTRFKFCPYCGKKIDWKRIKSEGKEA